jgi:hypothetical protein
MILPKEATTVQSINTAPAGGDKGEAITVLFSSSTERVEAWQAWCATRDEWRTPEVRTREAFAFFERLYELHALLEKDGSAWSSWSATAS